MKPILLCAGLGSRLGEVTRAYPKCLLELDGRTLLARQLDLLARLGQRRPRMVIGTKGECWQQAAYEAIRAHAVDLVFNFENDRNHNVYSMWLALRDLEPEDVLLLDGDLVFDEPLLRKLVTSPHEHVLVTSFAEAESTPGTRVVVSDGGTVVELGKRIAPRVFPWQIHSGMLKIGKRGFRDFVACLAEPQNLRGELEGAVSSFIRHHDVHTLCDEARAWANVNTARDLVHARALVGASNDAQLGI